MENNPEPTITPYLLYADVSLALAFLEKAFGFHQFGEEMSGADGRLNHAAMKLADGLIMLGCPGEGYKNPRQLGNVTHYIYVMVPDVDRHFEQARNAGAEILEACKDTPYGHRRYIAMDPEGHHWSFAQVIKE